MQISNLHHEILFFHYVVLLIFKELVLIARITFSKTYFLICKIQTYGIPHFYKKLILL